MPAELAHGLRAVPDWPATVSIALESVTDWPGFSHAVRALRAAGVAPGAVRWCVGEATSPDLFDAVAPVPACALPEAPAMRLPKSFVDPAREVFLHSSPECWPLLHGLAARVADDARAWLDPLHADRLQFDRLHREVRREIHKMHAFVRFRRIEAEPGVVGHDDDVAHDVAADRSTVSGEHDADASAPSARLATASTTRHVAWFEPEHHVLEAAAPFFARRFATMRWAILTPRVSVEWDGRALAFGPGAQRADAPGADAGEALWLAYYRSIFNPARVKVAMMKKEMPVRFWKNLPEAGQIGVLLAEAPQRQRQMIAAGGAVRERKRGQVDLGIDATGAAGGIGVDPTGAAGGIGVDPTDAATMLADLRRQAARCRDCPVADATTQTVFGEGSAAARLMIVGEQPGDHEDLRGRPFQGPAGQLLRAAFDELGWDADEVYLTNAVKHFHHELRGKRRMHKTPGQQEAAACLHWLEAEIAALRPEAIVALGATAARSLLGRDVGVTANEGQWFQREDGVPVLICLHPAAILRADVSRQPALRQRWIDSMRAASPHVPSSSVDAAAAAA